MCEWGAIRDERPADEDVGGSGALWAGAAFDAEDVLAFIVVDSDKSGLPTGDGDDLQYDLFSHGYWCSTNINHAVYRKMN